MKMMKSDEFIPYGKMSKKAKRESLRKHRKPPMPPKKVYNDVYKYKQKKQKGE
jgi:hypothetical protein